MDNEQLKKQALDYHSNSRPGKLEVKTSKPCQTADDLSLAYTPGVAYPCLEIEKNPSEVFKYTAKDNLVAVITNGTAVLGLGNIGPLASKPVMEGKSVLFKRFADVDVFDIEINEQTVEGMVKIISSLEPTFGGINLEDIKAPECFEIEKQLIEKMNIPVFHDDQHGTAIITAAAFINAIDIVGKKISNLKIVFSGAGAASIACVKILLDLGVTKEQIILCDSKGPVTRSRNDLNQYKQEFATSESLSTMKEAMKNADIFIGVSLGGIVSKDMIKSMAANPVIFAMANPTPEIFPEEIKEVRNDAIIATGRSDYPNQVNNVLGFPFIFRGALDVRAKKINKEMKIAAAIALANLAQKDITDEVRRAYGGQNFSFGPNYLIPKPFDTRVLTSVAPAVAKAAIDSGVSQKNIDNIDSYIKQLGKRITPLSE